MRTYQQKLGDAYEYYVLDAIREKYDRVWHWKQVPEKILYENNIIRDYGKFKKYKNDIGADIVAERDGVYYFIQCKNYTRATITIERLAGFYFLLHEYNLRGVLYYSGKLSARLIDLATGKIEFIKLAFNNETVGVCEDTRNTKNKLVPRDYQINAYSKLRGCDSAILSLPCGMGKTFISSLLAKDYDNIIILSPLRCLAFQMLQCYKELMESNYTPILISTDGQRNPKEISEYIGKKNIISSTYDSSDVTIKIAKKLKKVFVVVDEFHNLSKNNISNVDDNVYKIINLENSKKIFLSATPPNNFMDIGQDSTYNYSWKKAIENKYICDFNIFIPDRKEKLNDFAELLKKTCEITDRKLLILKTYYLLKCMIYNGDRKCICYLTNVKDSKKMKDIISWMKKILNIDCASWDINYRTAKTKRIEYVEEFKKTKSYAILLNVHILDEGIDIRVCDSVFITKPNNNVINIVQRMCRANRIMKYKDNCNIYLWCAKNKIKIVLDYIHEKTNGIIDNRVYIYNIKKHDAEMHTDYIDVTVNKQKYVSVEIIKKITNNKCVGYIVYDDEHKKPFFNGKGICELIGYGDHRGAIKTHVRTDNIVYLKNIAVNYNTLYKNAQGYTKFLSEAGVYELIMGSRTEKAKELQKWITNEVMPALGKT